MKEEFFVPDYLYQYTNLETLALILKNKNIKFNSLINVDDLEEAKGEEIDVFGKFIYASCWTDKAEENIALWNMYANRMQGVRIALPIYPFRDEKSNVEIQLKKYRVSLIEYGSDIIDLDEDKYIWKDFKMFNYYQLRQVGYTDNEGKLFPKIIKKDDENRVRIDQQKLGVYKRKQWEFQQEWRYLIYLGLKERDTKDAQKVISALKRIKRIPSNIFVEIEEECFKKMKVLLGPGTNEAYRIIVEALREKYNQDMVIEESYFKDKILIK